LEITLYGVLLFAHLTFVAFWVGGDLMLQAFALRAQAAGPERTSGSRGSSSSSSSP